MRSTVYGKTLAGFAALTGIALVVSATVITGLAVRSSAVEITVPDGVARIDPQTLEAVFTSHSGRSTIWSAPTPTVLGTPTQVEQDESGNFSWGYDQSPIRVTVTEEDGRVVTTMTSARRAQITWPVTGSDSKTQSIEFPNGQGQSVPVHDPFWWSEESSLTTSPWGMTDNLTMPFWGVSLEDAGVSYIVLEDIGTELHFEATQSHLTASATHDFDPIQDTSVYRVTMRDTAGGEIDAAKDFRSWLVSEGGIVTLDEKAAATPATSQLRGALHGYLWGAGDDLSLIARLQDLGIGRMWLG